MDNKNKNRLRTAVVQFIKFSYVGISNTAITYGLYALAVYILDSHRIALVIDYAFGIVYTFIMNKFFTFKKRNSGTGTIEFIRTIILYAVVFGVNWLLLNFLIEQRLWDRYFAQAVVIVVISFLSFFGQKYLVFKERH
ncbi:MAG: hypothetical protein B0D92_03665 [Spirochaeta sp. LUC14_002_19_P3]|nr:MAG: hypothetical protein B0D92_03665 [Spirochaeta sp. LUC14_002_19_P3]